MNLIRSGMVAAISLSVAGVRARSARSGRVMKRRFKSIHVRYVLKTS